VIIFGLYTNHNSLDGTDWTSEKSTFCFKAGEEQQFVAQLPPVNEGRVYQTTADLYFWALRRGASLFRLPLLNCLCEGWCGPGCGFRFVWMPMLNYRKLYLTFSFRLCWSVWGWPGKCSGISVFNWFKNHSSCFKNIT